MKRVFLLLSLVMLVACLPSTLLAQGTETGFYTKLLKIDNYAPSHVFESEVLDLQSFGTWRVWYTGSATVSGGSVGASLIGDFSGQNPSDKMIWKYEYSDTKTSVQSEVKWKTLDTLVKSLSAPARGSGDSGTMDGPSRDIETRWLRISYGATLSSAGNAGASASGSGSITAAAVPEPGTIFAALSVLAPAGFAFRRKRS